MKKKKPSHAERKKPGRPRGDRNFIRLRGRANVIIQMIFEFCMDLSRNRIGIV